MANKTVKQLYYAYYDKNSGQILEMTNEKKENNMYGIEVSYEEYDKFVSGVKKFDDYKIGYSTINDKIILSIIPKTKDDNIMLVNNLLKCISEPPLKHTELIIEWNNNFKKWIFNISNQCKKRLKTEITPKNFIFFITLNNDFDFLIRTIIIDSTELISKSIEIEFNNKLEEDIKKITISSILFFQSYGLKINE